MTQEIVFGCQALTLQTKVHLRNPCYLMMHWFKKGISKRKNEEEVSLAIQGCIY